MRKILDAEERKEGTTSVVQEKRKGQNGGGKKSRGLCRLLEEKRGRESSVIGRSQWGSVKSVHQSVKKGGGGKKRWKRGVGRTLLSDELAKKKQGGEEWDDGEEIS